MTTKVKNAKSKNLSNKIHSYFAKYQTRIDDNAFSKILSDEKPKESSYQDDLKKESKVKAHQREEAKKDLHHIISSKFFTFFSSVVKVITIIYLIGLVINIFFGFCFDLSKLEVIVYTIITTGLGILIDRTVFREQNN